MQRESHALSTPPCQYVPAQTTDSGALHGFDHGLSSNERVPYTTDLGPYTTMNHPRLGFSSQYTTNIGYGCPSSQVSGFGEQPQYANQGNHWQSISHNDPLSGASQNIVNPPVCPGPLRPVYFAPPAHSHDTLNGGTGGHAPPPSNVTLPPRGTLSAVPPGISVGEELIQLVSRYLQNPDSRCSGRVKVMVVLELNDVEWLWAW
ncbi:hypothetical protein BGW80DRAFT_1372292 [Lactifluus volemus]|nr:hypothetical protein BGW80DRAFT_1372292 [Lactifluus volemus]